MESSNLKRTYLARAKYGFWDLTLSRDKETAKIMRILDHEFRPDIMTWTSSDGNRRAERFRADGVHLLTASSWRAARRRSAAEAGIVSSYDLTCAKQQLTPRVHIPRSGMNQTFGTGR